MNGRLMDNETVIRFVNGGKAILTLVSKRTGTRFTYRVTESDNGEVFFVGVLSGPDNGSDYSYIGIVKDGTFRWTQKSRVSWDAPSVKAWEWFWFNIEAPKVFDGVEVWHEGKCCRCARPLTVPSSIASGMGPECAGKMATGLAIMGIDDLV